MITVIPSTIIVRYIMIITTITTVVTEAAAEMPEAVAQRQQHTRLPSKDSFVSRVHVIHLFTSVLLLILFFIVSITLFTSHIVLHFIML